MTTSVRYLPSTELFIDMQVSCTTNHQKDLHLQLNQLNNHKNVAYTSTKKKIIAENQELTYLPEEKKQLIQYTGVLAEQKFYCNIRQICFDCL